MQQNKFSAACAAGGYVPDAADVLAAVRLEDSIDFSRCVVFPGFCDVHVHLREPGFCYKETIRTGTRAAARGGYTDICSMPNLDPVPDTVPHLQVQLRAIAESAVVGVHPYGAVSMGEKGETPADLEGLAPLVAGFSDDGRGVQSKTLMLEAMRRAKALNKVIAAHCEDESLVKNGCIHDGVWAAQNGYPGICAESEWKPIQRDLELVRQTGCAYHVCHVSTRQSVELIRQAKRQGLDVTCETAPHYLLLCDEDLQPDGRFKMNPPLRSAQDRDALVQALADGTIDCIATDHAPHSAAEKAGGLRGSKMGVVGLETAFPVLYTGLVRTGRLTLQRLAEALCTAPRRRFGLAAPHDWCVWDLDTRYVINPAEFESMGKSTPFAGLAVYGRCLATVRKGEIVWQQN